MNKRVKLLAIRLVAVIMYFQNDRFSINNVSNMFFILSKHIYIESLQTFRQVIIDLCTLENRLHFTRVHFVLSLLALSNNCRYTVVYSDAPTFATITRWNIIKL